MNKYLSPRKRITPILLAATLGTAALTVQYSVNAQSTPEKIQLMAETLRARDSGNLTLAKQKAEELIKLTPDDENVQRLLLSINSDLERSGAGTPNVYGNAATESVERAYVSTDSGTNSDALIALAGSEQRALIKAADLAIDEAEKLTSVGAYSDAMNVLNEAASGLAYNTATADILEDLDNAKADVLIIQAEDALEAGDFAAAKSLFAQYRAAPGSDNEEIRDFAKKLKAGESDPYALSIEDVSPQFVAQNEIIQDLLTRGRAQYLNGDYDAAAATFKVVEARDANNSEAKLFQTKIAEILGIIHRQNQLKTREQMLTEVDQNWERPKVFSITDVGGGSEQVGTLKAKLESILIPEVNFSDMELTRVIETLYELSLEYDPDNLGVNIVPLFNPGATNPKVSISLRNLNLDKILQFVTQQVNFAYDVGDDVVTVSPDGRGGDASVITEFFPISRATRIRLTGVSDSGGSSSGPVDPFAEPVAASSSAVSGDEESELLQNFFQRAGVNFETQGSSLAFDGEQLIVTQTRRNLERMRVILRNYNEVKQVEIEAKFLEVSQNDLDELGFDWNLTDRAGNTVFTTGNNRKLANAFATGVDESSITINNPGEVIVDTTTVVGSDTDGDGEDDFFTFGDTLTGVIDQQFGVLPPSIPGTLDFAADVLSSTYEKGFQVGNGYGLDLQINALSRKTGSDLMSAPKVTVLSGKRANIVVAQELRYPESYGDIESTVSSSNIGGAAISITAGTPQDFVTRNVGVELSVTPNVENDDTISLILEPRVTEFEGFVEFGGPSVALADGTTVTVPAGFYQPIFSTREMSTEVTIFDGATVVMGGLTRDEVKTVSDKVPFLGDVPGLGRLFRSEGETRQKRNLLIFVTANLVSPGGSPARQSYRNVKANELFQNPTIMTPSGAANRSIPADVQ